jgi:hypothetical protein
VKFALLLINYNLTDACDGVYDSYDEVVAELNRFCTEHGWTYVLDAGVMLGDPFNELRDMTGYLTDWTEDRATPDQRWNDDDVAMYFHITPERD